jgi:hypothetical protein
MTYRKLDISDIKNFKTKDDINYEEINYLMSNKLRLKTTEYIFPFWICKKNIRNMSYDYGYNKVANKLDLRTYLTIQNRFDCLLMLLLKGDEYNFFNYLYENDSEKLTSNEGYKAIVQKLNKSPVEIQLLNFANLKKSKIA